MEVVVEANQEEVNATDFEANSEETVLGEAWGGP
jgi:hypothetical protein